MNLYSSIFYGKVAFKTEGGNTEYEICPFVGPEVYAEDVLQAERRLALLMPGACLATLESFPDPVPGDNMRFLKSEREPTPGEKAVRLHEWQNDSTYAGAFGLAKAYDIAADAGEVIPDELSEFIEECGHMLAEV